MVYITSCSVNVQDLCSNYSACTSTTVFLKFAVIGRRLEYKLYKNTKHVYFGRRGKIIRWIAIFILARYEWRDCCISENTHNWNRNEDFF